MITIVWVVALVIFGVILITKGSAWMTDSLVPVAEKLGTTYIAVATILVSIMLSIPEVFVAVYSFFMGHGGISLGVIIGSIICNIALMTGLSAIIRPLKVDGRVVIRDGVLALVISIIIFIFGLDLGFDRKEGSALLLLFVPYFFNVWFFEKWRSKKEKKRELKDISRELREIGMDGKHRKHGISLFVLGAIALLFGSYIFSDALINLAKLTGLSEVLIGITLGAIGPSVPNIASAIQGTLKNHTKIAITETFGSDIFTLLVTLGLLAVIAPFSIDQKWIYFDIPMMIMMNFLMMFFIFKGHIKKQEAILRYEGVILLASYICFIALNVWYLT